ncbi:MAG: ATP-dependent Clp protease proteolytic subunit [Candidatus Celerinatantimonas neptuna]|nr:MAG: ATP-dependent Clp protease proteolytic subunit [Candidatus Celerinatantimonas neptuna]
MKKFSIKALLSILMFLISSSCFAQWSTTGIDSVINSEVKSINVFYMAPIDNNDISDLISSIIEINNKYKKARHIYLYMSTLGGNENSAFAAYQVIKSSKIPVTTINLSSVASAGNILFCAAKHRQAFKNTMFIFHPISFLTNNAPNYSDLTPAKLANIKNMIKNFQVRATKIFKQCTNFNDEAIQKPFYSEGNRYILYGANAIKHHLINGYVSGIKNTTVTYYINDDEK